jgi:hypothetical protein
MIKPSQFAVQATIEHAVSRSVIRMRFHGFSTSRTNDTLFQLARIKWSGGIVWIFVSLAKVVDERTEGLTIDDVAATVRAETNVDLASQQTHFEHLSAFGTLKLSKFSGRFYGILR